MTLPALGVIGLTFMCMVLVAGIVFLLLLANPSLRHRLCETLASYRSQPKEGKASTSKRKRKNTDNGFEDMYTSRVPPPIEMRPQSFRDTPQQYAMQYNQGYPPPGNQQKTVRNPYEQPQKSQQYHQQYPSQQHQQPRQHSGNPYISHPQRQQPQQQQHIPHSGHQAKRQAAGKVVGYTSSGTNSPHDSAIGTMDGKGIHGILKHTSNDSSKGNAQGPRSSRTKSVVYEDEIKKNEIS